MNVYLVVCIRCVFECVYLCVYVQACVDVSERFCVYVCV